MDGMIEEGTAKEGKDTLCFSLFSFPLVEHCFLFQTNKVQVGPAGGARAKERTRSVGTWSGWDRRGEFFSFVCCPPPLTNSQNIFSFFECGVWRTGGRSKGQGVRRATGKRGRWRHYQPGVSG